MQEVTTENIINTGDNSQTIRHPENGETYHSVHGAITESICVFINAGINYLNSQGITRFDIFEMGLGTGLNALLTAMYAKHRENLDFHYDAIDTLFLKNNLVEKLTYPHMVKFEDADVVFNQIHSMPINETKSLIKNFHFQKQQIDFHSFIPSKKYNIIFYDAFAPNCQPELWNISSFEKLNSMLVINGIVTTYCAKGQVKRDLKSCGFEIEALPGPPGKREMTRAIKKREI